jgi:hypothetical protein
MTGWGAYRRGEAALALLGRLRRRPVLRLPAEPEPPEALYARIDTPGHAAALGDDQYNAILNGDAVAWKSVLAFLTQDEAGETTRAFWIDPLRLRCFGCRLDRDDLEVLSPFFGPEPRPARGASEAGDAVQIDHERLELKLGELEPGARFRLADGKLGEVAERFASDHCLVSAYLDPDCGEPTPILLGPETTVFPARDDVPRVVCRAIRRRGKLRLVPRG